jgi:nucleoside-diphosphate-sugar epimerase
MTHIAVTGGSGKAGRAVVRDLLAHGYQVVNIDQTPPAEQLCRFRQADLTDLGEVFEALGGMDAVVHLAAIPNPDRFGPAHIFANNTLGCYNVFTAAVQLKLGRVVWASSETTLGLPFARQPPVYAPIDEEHPLLPESSYALSKVVSEEMARQFNRWSGIPFAALRLSNIKEPQQYADFPGYWSDARLRKWNLWGYVDVRDVAQVCRMALEAPLSGAEAFIIAAADTVMTRPNRELLAEVFPGLPLRRPVSDFETLLSIEKARQMLGYAPRFSWRDHLKDPNAI